MEINMQQAKEGKIGNKVYQVHQYPGNKAYSSAYYYRKHANAYQAPFCAD
jgi:hypothetical protein